MEEKIARHGDLCCYLSETYAKKNSDYGDSFHKSYERFGITAALVRMEDKWNRINNLAFKEDYLVRDESIKDTLLDLANYCLMTYLELEEEENARS